MAPGFLPLLLWFVPHADPVSPRLRVIVIAIIAVLGAFIFARYRQIARPGELRDRTATVVGYAGSVLAMLLLFPADLELAMTVLAVLAFGDGSATLGGLLIGGPNLPWNRKKTWAGLLCFLLVGSAMASVVYWGETHFNPEALGPRIPFTTALICGSAAACVAGLVESLPLRLPDNIRVGLSAAITVVIAHGLMVGWP